MELADVMRTTAAAREFTPTRVPDEQLFRILDNARFAPSGGNGQGWHVTVIENLATRRSLADLCRPIWQQYLGYRLAGRQPFGVLDTDPAPDPVEGANPVLDDVENIARILVVTVDLSVLAAFDQDLDRLPIIAGASIYPFVHNILLAARNEGLGGVLTTFLAAAEPQARGLLGFPDTHALVAMVALGEPTKQITKLTRKGVADFATIDTFDGPEFGSP